MALPSTIRVKLSPEEAQAISIAPVVVREMPLRDLVALMLDLTGKDVQRVADLLLRGVLVVGGSRYRWDGWPVDLPSLQELLDTFPSPDPRAVFDSERCHYVWLETMTGRTEISRADLARHRFLRRRSFWDELVRTAREAGLAYRGYSYRVRADRFRLELRGPALQRLAASAPLLAYSGLENLFRNGKVRAVEFLVERP